MSENKKIPVVDENEEAAAVETLEADGSQRSEPVGAEEELEPEEQIAALEQQLKEMREKWIRGVADMDNLRKRTKRDVEEAAIRGRTDVLREILPAIDSIDLALNTVDENTEINGIVQGMEMVRKQFLTATERFGLKAVESEKKAFDPNFHEAVAQVESAEHEAGQIVEEMRKGYVLGDRLLRATMVVVSKGKPEPAAATDGAEDEVDVQVDDEENDV